MNEILQLSICAVGLWFGLMMLYNLHRWSKWDKKVDELILRYLR